MRPDLAIPSYQFDIAWFLTFQICNTLHQRKRHYSKERTESCLLTTSGSDNRPLLLFREVSVSALCMQRGAWSRFDSVINWGFSVWSRVKCEVTVILNWNARTVHTYSDRDEIDPCVRQSDIRHHPHLFQSNLKSEGLGNCWKSIRLTIKLTSADIKIRSRNQRERLQANNVGCDSHTQITN